jgi:hypothetical protein
MLSNGTTSLSASFPDTAALRQSVCMHSSWKVFPFLRIFYHFSPFNPSFRLIIIHLFLQICWQNEFVIHTAAAKIHGSLRVARHFIVETYVPNFAFLQKDIIVSCQHHSRNSAYYFLVHCQHLSRKKKHVDLLEMISRKHTCGG